MLVMLWLMKMMLRLSLCSCLMWVSMLVVCVMFRDVVGLFSIMRCGWLMRVLVMVMVCCCLLESEFSGEWIEGMLVVRLFSVCFVVCFIFGLCNIFLVVCSLWLRKMFVVMLRFLYMVRFWNMVVMLS